MARSKLDTLIYATILLAPMATAVGYIAMTPDTEVVVIREPPAPIATIEADLAGPAPTPTDLAPEVPPVVEPAPVPEASPVVDAPAPPPGTPGAAMLLYDGQVVLVTQPDVAWAKGPLRAPPSEFGVVASKAVDPTRLPAELAPLVNARVVVHASDGSTCTATTDAMTIYGRRDGEFYFDRADGELDENGELTAAGLLAVRKEVFADAQVMLARLVGGSVAGQPHRCTGVWARRADLPAPTVFGRRTLDERGAEALDAQVLAVIEDLPEIVSLREAYVDHRAGRLDRDELPQWPAWRDEALIVTRWDEIGGTRSFVNVEVGDGGDECSGIFSERRALLFTLADGELVRQPGDGFFAPLALLDLERDGLLEVVLDGGKVMRNQSAGSDPESAVQSYYFPWHGCSC